MTKAAKIAIIGAGIGGLTLGLACQKAGMKVKIYEKASKLHDIGGGILLWPNGQRYLQWLGLGHLIQSHYIKVNDSQIIGTDGEVVFHQSCEPVSQRLGGTVFPIDRSFLQMTFANELENKSLVLAKECIDICHEEHEIKLLFSDGTVDSADIVVGADGVRSIVRGFIKENSYSNYTGYCWWGGIISQHDVPALPTDRVTTILGVNKVCIVWPLNDNKFMWYLPIKMAENELNKAAGWKQIEALCQDWNNDTVKQIIAAPTNSRNFNLPIYHLSPLSRYAHGRTVIIGDAAHAIAPILGQGANLAIEDAYTLFICLKTFPTDIEKAGYSP
ncbi:MAG: NAD(P)-binding protein [Legionellales bacterium]|nr:NAD(P)-binding protein [Legionellales bacterium]